jgi:hypothetical protein
MTDDIEQLFRAAITKKQSVNMVYEGDDGPERVVHPHALFTATTDKLSISVYQVDGYTSGRDLPHWRDFTFAKIMSATLGSDTFEIADGFNLSSPKYARGVHAYVRP